MSENGTGLNGPCRHLGPIVERRRVRTPLSAKIVLVHSCAAFGSCTPSDPAPGLACCLAPDGTRCHCYQSYPFLLIAPLGTRELYRRAEGRITVKPWEYKVSVAIPHLDSLELLRSVVELHRLQTIKPYIMVIDTGSPEAVVKELEEMRAEDLEIHYVRSHAYRHSSAPVTTAMDVAFALTRTQYLFCTHSDVFPRRRDFLEWMIGQCGEASPAVGWEMSPRVGINGWKGTLSHTATMLYMPVMWMIGATWSMDRWYSANPTAPPTRNGWPDTETCIDEVFRNWGVKKVILGGELNFERQITDWWDHVRSITSLRLYAKDSDVHQKAEGYSAEALADAKVRARTWAAEGRP